MTLTPEVYEKLKTIAYGKDAVCASTLRNFLDSVEIEKETEEGNRTGQQNRGLHKFCSLLADIDKMFTPPPQETVDKK